MRQQARVVGLDMLGSLLLIPRFNRDFKAH
jgi:hypothetical protein